MALRQNFLIVPFDGIQPFHVTLSGRDEWALSQLILAGNAGCTPIKNPAPRWSAYIHNCRSLGIPIETFYEPHGGDFPGTHGRYVLMATATKAPNWAGDARQLPLSLEATG